MDRPFTPRTVHYNEKNILRRRLGQKVYKKKTYTFVSDIWNLFVRVIGQDEKIDAENSDNYEKTDNQD